MIENDLISVLIPAYNAEKYLHKAIKSVLKQTYRNFELIILDDGSTDQTKAIAEQFAATDSRVKVYTKQNERNLGKTRNHMMQYVTGKYMVWVDSDDTVHPKFLENLYRAITTADADLAVCGFRAQIFNFPLCRPWVKRTKTYTSDVMYDRLILGLSFVMWNKIFKTELARQVSFVEKSVAEDFWYCLAYLKHCRKIAITNDRLYRYILRKGSVSHKKFSAAELEFVQNLTDAIAAEPDAHVREVLCAWLAFSSGMYTLLADKKQYAAAIPQLKDNFYQYKHYFLQNKMAKKMLKLLMRLSTITWNRRRKKTFAWI